MKNALVASVVLVVLVMLAGNLHFTNDEPPEEAVRQADEAPEYREIAGNIQKGETLSDIFRKYEIEADALFRIREASAHLHRLRDLHPGRSYRILLDGRSGVHSFAYWIDDDTILNVLHTGEGFRAEKTVVQYEKRIEYIGGAIKGNLVSSMGNERGASALALRLSDIFAWDIDFTSDIRNDDLYRIAVEGLYLDGEFKKYGDIVAAEFVNDGRTFRAYRYEVNGKADFYDEEGRSMRKAFLKAPLNFRRISSFFSSRRKHPLLKIYRPHHGVDYVAPAGTPVSTVGDGKVSFAGRKGQYGRLVIVQHRNGYRTYYGHLSGIAKGIRTGTHVEQGQLIGYVGATGLATGPHLHYEMRISDKPLNPLSVKMPQEESVPQIRMADFVQRRNVADVQFASGRFTSHVPAGGGALLDSQ
ncbi:MAG TPA: peptidoglycan DD-metalloendopeptidase family protein [Syntrophales bacterium]|nr:peptidoglycan DD-metalloendopeptidase family protein [Syntrophales bacterium]